VSIPFPREHLFSALQFKSRELWCAINGIPRFYNSFMLLVWHRVYKTDSLDLRYLSVGQNADSFRKREPFPIIVYNSSMEKTTGNLLRPCHLARSWISLLSRSECMFWNVATILKHLYFTFLGVMLLNSLF
jgi:hypothetical protein